LAHEQKEKDLIKFWTHNKETQKKKELEVGQIYSVFLFQAKIHTVATKNKIRLESVGRVIFWGGGGTRTTPHIL
jgi:hypothetical protein